MNLLARQFSAEVLTVDIGINSDIEYDNIINRKVSHGTHNIAKSPAMDIEHAHQAINVGIDIVRELYQKGTDIIITGEMGIGNTTPMTAITCALDAERVLTAPDCQDKLQRFIEPLNSTNPTRPPPLTCFRNSEDMILPE